MFVDEVDIQVHAGDGGNGCMAFRREMRVPRGGPSGGDGGLGGSIYLVATLHQNTLVTYRFHPEFKAERGQHGQGSNCTGHNGADMVLEVPPGTVVYDNTGGDLIQMADLAPSATACSSRAADAAGAATRPLRRRPIARRAGRKTASLVKRASCACGSSCLRTWVWWVSRTPARAR